MYCICKIYLFKSSQIQHIYTVIITESMNETVNNRTYPYPMNSTEDPLEMQVTRRDYTAEIENLDRSFNIIINKFRELGQYDNTVFCVSSDHGMVYDTYLLCTCNLDII